MLWVDATGIDPGGGLEATSPREVRGLLGRSYDAVVLDVHHGLWADVLGQCQGFIWGGGALILRMPPEGQRPLQGRAHLAAHPYGVEDVGWRFYDRVARVMTHQPDVPAPISSPSHIAQGTADQLLLLERLVTTLTRDEPRLTAVLADRGRGKSSALGLALREALEARDQDVVITAGDPGATREIFDFLYGDPTIRRAGPARFVPAVGIALKDTHAPQVIVVDEAAQLPVPLLQRMVRRHRSAHFVFATTTRGYEGTGRGFTLRFLEWAAAQRRRLEVLELTEPIRWAPEDPLEARVFEALLLDAQPAPIEPRRVDPARLEHRLLDRDELAGDEQLLRDFFGLMIQAHYRTTPGDLHRMLDAPNLDLHALLLGGRVVAATLVAQEGELDLETCEALYWGRERIRAHALPDSLVTHLGRRLAGRMKMRRSVRIATHPALRRQGLATRLIEHVHQAYDPDLFGTIFGATPGLLAFRRSVDYELVRISASRGSRTGEPAVMMMRPVSDRARALISSLRADLARELPLQIELLTAGDELLLEPALERAMRAGLPSPAPLSAPRRRELLAAYAFGPRTMESVAGALDAFVREHEGALARLEPGHAALLRARVLARQSWTESTRRAQINSVPAAMRALRRAVRELVELAAPEIAALEPS